MKKKILFIESRFRSFFGAQKSMIKLIKALEKEKFECNVLLTEKGLLERELKNNNIEADIVKLGKKSNVFGGEVIKYNILNKLQVLLEILLFNIKLIFYLLKHKHQIVYVNDLRAFFYSVIACKLLRRKIVWYIRTDINESTLTKLGLKYSDYVVTIAKGVLRDISPKTIRRYENKIINIYTGFNFDKIKIINKENAKKELGLHEESIVVGYAGSINYRKGLDLLIDTLIDLSEDVHNMSFLMSGQISDGYQDYWEELERKLSENEICYKFIGYQSDISQALNAMDILVLPSRSEGLPRIVIEGMGHALPVIATDVGGTREIIESSEFGFLIKKDSKKELKTALYNLIKSSELRVEMGKSSRKHVKRKFSYEKFKIEINKLFENI